MVRSLVSFAVLALVPAYASSAECLRLLDAVRATFQQHNPLIHDVQILDVKPKHSKYWVIGRGIRQDRNAVESLNDELFGIFVVDSTLSKIDVILDVFPTKRWQDYSVWIHSYSIENLTVRGHGATYRDTGFEATYESPVN